MRKLTRILIVSAMVSALALSSLAFAQDKKADKTAKKMPAKSQSATAKHHGKMTVKSKAAAKHHGKMAAKHMAKHHKMAKHTAMVHKGKMSSSKSKAMAKTKK